MWKPFFSFNQIPSKSGRKSVLPIIWAWSPVNQNIYNPDASHNWHENISKNVWKTIWVNLQDCLHCDLLQAAGEIGEIFRPRSSWLILDKTVQIIERLHPVVTQLCSSQSLERELDEASLESSVNNLHNLFEMCYSLTDFSSFGASLQHHLPDKKSNFHSR